MISFESWRPAPERRSYTGDVLAYFHAEATGRTAQAATTGALQTAAGLLARAFSAAMPTGDLGLLTPFVLADIGFDLMRRGESVWLFQVDADGPALLRAGRTAGAAVQGTADPRTWRYVLTLPGPGSTRTVNVGAESVLHLRINTEPSTPWRGRSPIELARLTGRLSASLEDALGKEAEVLVARVVPVPDGTGQDMADDMRSKVADPNLPGRLAFPTTTARGFGAGVSNAPQADWPMRRFGPEYGTNDAAVYQAVTAAVLAACGIPPALADPKAAGPGQRESWRSFLVGCVQPLAALIEQEASRVLERPVKLRHHRLAAADVASRARAVNVLTDSGVPVDEARELVGWRLD